MVKVAVVGAGGVGGVVAASLAAAARCSLSVVARGQALATLRSHGLRVRLYEGRTVEARPAAVAPEETATLGPQDYVVVSTKAHQLEAAAPALAPLLGPHTRLVTLMNGLPFWWRTAGRPVEAVDPGGRLSALLPPPDRVIASVGMVAGSRVVDPETGACVWLNKWPTNRSSVLLGGALGPASDGQSQAFAELFDPSGPLPLPVRVTEDIRGPIWEKLMINASINTLATIARVDVGQIVDDPGLAEALRSICGEVGDVAAAQGLSLEQDAEAVLGIYRGMYGVKPSMLQDFEAGRALEKDPIVRAVLEVGRASAVPTPALAIVANLLDALERHRL